MLTTTEEEQKETVARIQRQLKHAKGNFCRVTNITERLKDLPKFPREVFTKYADKDWQLKASIHENGKDFTVYKSVSQGGHIVVVEPVRKTGLIPLSSSTTTTDEDILAKYKTKYDKPYTQTVRPELFTVTLKVDGAEYLTYTECPNLASNLGKNSVKAVYNKAEADAIKVMCGKPLEQYDMTKVVRWSVEKRLATFKKIKEATTKT